MIRYRAWIKIYIRVLTTWNYYRAFLRRLIDLTRGISQPNFFIRLNRSVKSNLRIWQTFLSSFNGKSLFLDDHWPNNQKLNLYTDASGAIGFGALFGQEWCYGKWPENWLKYNIAVLEFYPIALNLCLWGHRMRNQCVLFFTNNQSLVSVINKQTFKDAEYILCKAKHVAGRRNVLADRLSRFQVDQFLQLAPVHMHRFPTSIPSHLLPANWQL